MHRFKWYLCFFRIRIERMKGTARCLSCWFCHWQHPMLFHYYLCLQFKFKAEDADLRCCPQIHLQGPLSPGSWLLTPRDAARRCGCSSGGTANALPGARCSHHLTGLSRAAHSGQTLLLYKRLGKPLQSRLSLLSNKYMLTFSWLLRTSYSWCFHFTEAPVPALALLSGDGQGSCSEGLERRPPQSRCIQSHVTCVLLGTRYSCQLSPVACLIKYAEYLPSLFISRLLQVLSSFIIRFITCLSLEPSTHQLRIYKTESSTRAQL